MKITIVIAVLMLAGTASLNAQAPAAKPEQVKLYDPSLDGMKQIKDAIAKVKGTKKHVLIQYGGNWCGWCIKFDAYCKADTAISRLIDDNYLPVKLNYSPENKNDEANAFLGNPTRFGFPVFIIIDGNGKVLHIQDSGLLEEGSGYSKQKVTGFFRNWTSVAIVPRVAKPSPAK